MKREFTCINCPMGCPLVVELDESGKNCLSVTGNRCLRGEKYGRSEATAPVRMLTTLIVPATGGNPIAVRTSAPIPKELLPKAKKVIHQLKITSGMTHQGQVLLENLCGTGVNLIQTSP